MKNMIKRLSSLALALLLVFSLSATAMAADASITFRGFAQGFEFKPGSEYTATDLFDNFKNVMPGDTLTQTVTFTNAAKDCDFVKLYIRALAHDEQGNPLSPRVAESETVATMTEFLAQLSMKVYQGETLIFSGSPDQLDGLSENVYLGEVRADQTLTLTVELSVPLTLDNRFAKRVGEVDWIFHVEAFNESQISVRKVWSDGNANHANDSITVNLLRDGEYYDNAVLNANNNWAYTFDKLVETYTWTVEEAEVPEGYSVSYEVNGNEVTIINTLDTVPTPPPVSNWTEIGVRKIWSDGNANHRGESITVNLLRDGVVNKTAVLSADNNWHYTFTRLNDAYTWTVEEAEVPEGYTVSYGVSGNVIVITNTKDEPETPPVEPVDPTPVEPPVEPVSLTVKKTWSNDAGRERPTSVTVTLYNGEVAYETVVLNDENGWAYTWAELSPDGNWQIVERNIPKGYTPTYSVSGDVITVTNTAKLIQTGQLNWPIVVLGGLGVALVVLGAAMLLTKKRRNA